VQCCDLGMRMQLGRQKRRVDHTRRGGNQTRREFTVNDEPSSRGGCAPPLGRLVYMQFSFPHPMITLTPPSRPLHMRSTAGNRGACPFKIAAPRLRAEATRLTVRMKYPALMVTNDFRLRTLVTWCFGYFGAFAALYATSQ